MDFSSYFLSNVIVLTLWGILIQYVFTLPTLPCSAQLSKAVPGKVTFGIKPVINYCSGRVQILLFSRRAIDNRLIFHL